MLFMLSTCRDALIALAELLDGASHGADLTHLYKLAVKV